MRNIWKPVAFNDKYLVSIDGFVKNSKTGKILKPSINKGYAIYFLANGKNKKPTIKSSHRLVIESFVGPCPDGHECCHIDGNSLNNSLENLKWATPKENTLDKFKHGTVKNKISDEQCLEIIKLYCSNISIKEIAEKYNVKKSCIMSILKGSRKNVRVSVLMPEKKKRNFGMLKLFSDLNINQSSFYYLKQKGFKDQEIINYLNKKDKHRERDKTGRFKGLSSQTMLES